MSGWAEFALLFILALIEGLSGRVAGGALDGPVVELVRQLLSPIARRSCDCGSRHAASPGADGTRLLGRGGGGRGRALGGGLLEQVKQIIGRCRKGARSRRERRAHGRQAAHQHTSTALLPQCQSRPPHHGINQLRFIVSFSFAADFHQLFLFRLPRTAKCHLSTQTRRSSEAIRQANLR